MRFQDKDFCHKLMRVLTLDEESITPDPDLIHALLRMPCSSNIRGAKADRRDLRTKALMRDLGTRLECRLRVFCKNWKNIVEVKSIVAQPDSNLLPSGQ